MRKPLLFLCICLASWAAAAQDLELNLTQFRDDFDTTIDGQSFGTVMQADGIWAVISAPFADGADGAVYIFRYDNGWNFHKKLEEAPGPSNRGRSGTDVTIDGEWLAITFTFGGAALYRRDLGGAGNWGYHSTVDEPDSTEYRDQNFDNRVALGGTTLIVGAPVTDQAPFSADTNSVGALLIYQLQGNEWLLTQRVDIPVADLQSNARFGDRLDINSGILVVGSPDYDTDGFNTSGRAWVYQQDGGQFQLVDTLTSDSPGINERFGSGVASGTGFIAIGSLAGAADLTPMVTNDGSVYVFEPDNGDYLLTTELVASDSTFIGLFGQDVAVESNLLWTSDNRASYLFRRDAAGDWTEIDRNEAPVFPAPSNVLQYGTSVALTREGTRIHGLVGDRVAENIMNERVGAAFFYEFDDGLFADSFED
ncbi:MAG: hypothetical protein AB8B96_22230 [Lysobacterales bacterium]